MKVLIYTHAFSPEIGGIETCVRLLAEGLAARLSGGTSGVSVGTGGITVVTQSPQNGSEVPADGRLGFQVVRQPRLPELVSLIRNADVIHLAGPAILPLALALLFRRRVVVEHHGFQAVCPNGQFFHQPARRLCPGHFMEGNHRQCLRCNRGLGTAKSVNIWLSTFVRRRLCKRATANIAPTHWLADLLQLPRTVVIHHGIQDSPQVKTNGKLLPSEPPTFCFVGRLVGTKGVDILLEAAQQLEVRGVNFRLKIIGNGPERAKFEELSHRLGLDDCVTFTGFLTASELESALSGTVAVIVPSLAGEVFGLVVAEQMRNGRLLIISDLGSFREVTEGAALEFPSGNPDELATRMEMAIRNPAGSEEMKRRAQKRAIALFDYRSMVDRHLRLYQEVLTN